LLELEIYVFNLMGQLVQASQSSDLYLNFDLQSLGKGIYFLQVSDKVTGQNAVRKVVVN
jgi:hypothetical protein